MTKPTHAGHKEIADHSPEQQRMFFAVVHALGLDTKEVKERAKAHFKVGCFNELTKEDLMFLIDSLVEKQMGGQYDEL